MLPLKYQQFTIDSDWFKGNCEIVTYELEELIATKLRALYQRRKGRDLFDLWYVLKHKQIDINQVINIFQQYCVKGNIIISKELFQKNMELKRLSQDFQLDMNVLLPHQTDWNFEEAFELVHTQIINKIL